MYHGSVTDVPSVSASGVECAICSDTKQMTRLTLMITIMELFSPVGREVEMLYCSQDLPCAGALLRLLFRNYGSCAMSY